MDMQPVKGMRDLIGQDAMIQETIEGNFRKVYAKYGYLPLYTPAVESFDLFKVKGGAGEAIKEEIYYFKDKSDRELGLRFEFTASLARVAATNQLKMPFKRYQIGEVYRYDRPQAKRYRAFTQSDIDILGVRGMEAELEVMLVTRDCFNALGLKPKVVFNSRKLLEELLTKYGPGKEIEAMRILDKMEKVGKNDCIKMLEEKGIDASVVDLIEMNSLVQIEKKVGAESEGIKEVKQFIQLCKENKLDFVEYNSTLVRGLEYYTGTVFEIKLENGPSVGGGGRFDKLIEVYGGQSTPAVGISFGVSRIFDYLKEKNFKVGFEGIYLFGIGVEPGKTIQLAEELRAKGIFVETDLVGKNLSKNIEFAEKKGYTFVGILGENEIKAGVLTIKNIQTGKQEQVKIKDTQKLLDLVMRK